MAFRCFALREILVSIVGVGLLASLALPVFVHTGSGGWRRTGCANNLRQLYALCTVYASTHKGRWPEAQGEELWLSFTRTVPPLLNPDDIDLLACPVRGEDPGPGRTDYFGPREPASSLKPNDILGGDKRGNHGDDGGGNLLHKDGSVHELESTDPRWADLDP